MRKVLVLTIALAMFSTGWAQTKVKGTKATVTQKTVKQRGTGSATLWTPAEGEWKDVPVFPKGAQMKVISGDPGKGASDLYVKFPAGYVAPLHWHTPAESVYVQSGSLEFGMQHSDQTHTIGAGGFFHSPPKMIHKATCSTKEDCYFFLHSTGAFDIHLVTDTTAK
jgi:quercetin dioxygenase-like cupin family protein